MPEFIHLHNHSQYSLLDGASSIEEMLDKAAQDGQKGVALTDHGNMFGAFKFVNEAQKRNLKAIIGCEFYLVNDRHKQSFKKSKGEKDRRNHQLLLAKSAAGYKNLMMLCSLGFMEGMYGKFPRIDHELIEKYHEGLIATSCCIAAEIPQAIIHGDNELAEERLKWWLNIFGDDFYIEIMRHGGLENITVADDFGRRRHTGVSQDDVNNVLLQFANKYNVKVIATNDSHYVEEDDWLPHDILLCVNTGNKLSDPKGDGKGMRFGFPSNDFFFKTQEQMNTLFKDVPQAIDNTMEIYGKVDDLKLERDVLLPVYPVPSQFEGENEYLRHITYEGAKKRYPDMTAEVRERIDFELQTIANIGYPGYFLIVQDFTTTARERGIAVGPGRGSAAGSAVAYCLGITNIDPIKYDLLFERFLNPERISLPDIDIDFDDEGRQEIIDYVVEKYGFNQVAQIVTYGTMKAKSSIKDVGRVLDIPLNAVTDVTKLVPDTSLKKILDDENYKNIKSSLRPDDIANVEKLREMYKNTDDVNHISKMLTYAKKLEGSVRNVGVHACGVVITPNEVFKNVPVSMTKDNPMLISQYDNSVAEDAGLLKMDFLGLKTLSIIKDAIKLVEENHNIFLDPDTIPLDDEKTYELFQDGNTVGVFQFESPGMSKYMRELKPTQFTDLIAMNALYRPGPIKYIPDFIARKHGEQEIHYDLPEMKEYLEDTYGITVYQEQVMLLSQKLASFTKGEADSLRKGMGKKKKSVIDKLYPKYLEGGMANGHPEKVLNKIWKDWEAFAEYAFNKSHSTCYTSVAFTTAYLKANYPAEYMASVLTHNKSDISKVSFFLREARKMGINLKPPHVNYSRLNFTVNEEGDLVMGLSALKGVGEGPVDAIIEARKEGPFEDIYDFAKRVDNKAVNKRVMEALSMAGALDDLGLVRSQFVISHSETENFITEIIRYGLAFQESGHAAVQSLFAGMEETTISKPIPPDIEEYNLLEKLDREKQITGLYVTGHPLDNFELEFRLATNAYLSEHEQLAAENKSVQYGGIITASVELITKKGSPMGKFTVQDYRSAQEFVLFDEDYQKFKHILKVGTPVYLKGQWKKRYIKAPLRFYIEDIRHLEKIGTEKLKRVTLNIDPAKLTDETIARLSDVLQNSEGIHSIQINLQFEDQVLELEANENYLNIDMELINYLNDVGISFSLN